MDKRTYLVRSIRENVVNSLDTLLDALPFPKTPSILSHIERITLAYIKDYFKLRPEPTQDILNKDREGWYED